MIENIEETNPYSIQSTCKVESWGVQIDVQETEMPTWLLYEFLNPEDH